MEGEGYLWVNLSYDWPITAQPFNDDLHNADKYIAHGHQVSCWATKPSHFVAKLGYLTKEANRMNLTQVQNDKFKEHIYFIKVA